MKEVSTLFRLLINLEGLPKKSSFNNHKISYSQQILQIYIYFDKPILTTMKLALSTILMLFSVACYSQTLNTENGYTLPVKGIVKVLVIFADVLDPSETVTTPSAYLAGYGEAPLEADALEYFDLDYDGD